MIQDACSTTGSRNLLKADTASKHVLRRFVVELVVPKDAARKTRFVVVPDLISEPVPYTQADGIEQVNHMELSI